MLPQDLATFATVCSFIVRCHSAQRGQLTLRTTTRAIAIVKAIASATGGELLGKSGDGIGEYIHNKRGYFQRPATYWRRHFDAVCPFVRLFAFRTQKDNACLSRSDPPIAVLVWRQTEHTELTTRLQNPTSRRPTCLLFFPFC